MWVVASGPMCVYVCMCVCVNGCVNASCRRWACGCVGSDVYVCVCVCVCVGVCVYGCVNGSGLACKCVVLHV